MIYSSVAQKCGAVILDSKQLHIEMLYKTENCSAIIKYMYIVKNKEDSFKANDVEMVPVKFQISSFNTKSKAP